MDKQKQKRMIYIYEENLEFYDALKNKSQFINDALQDSRVNERLRMNKTQAEDPNWHPDPRIRETRAAVAAMDAKNKAAQQ
jgi:hypothetical protein